MSQHDYIPRPDADFDAWAASFMDYAAKHQAALGLRDATLEELHQLQKNWDTDYEAAVAARAAWRAAAAAKQNRRASFVAALRRVAAQLRGTPEVTDAQRAALGLTVPDLTPTAVGAPVSAPRGAVDTAQRLQHALVVTDEAAPTRRAKPAGVFGVEVRVALRPAGAPLPADLDAYLFVGVFTRSPATLIYDGATPGLPADAGGQTAHYQLRWLNQRGQPGPWGQVVSATVGA